MDLIHFDKLDELDKEENRLIIKALKSTLLREETATQHDKILMVLNSVIEIIFEGFKRDAQMANMLVRTTKLMDHVFNTLKQTIDRYNG